jgi:hypothetical protein
MLTDADSAKRERAMGALMGMKKFDVEALQRAFAGNHDGSEGSPGHHS